jgi:hypothetical protein
MSVNIINILNILMNSILYRIYINIIIHRANTESHHLPVASTLYISFLCCIQLQISESCNVEGVRVLCARSNIQHRANNAIFSTCHQMQ